MSSGKESRKLNRIWRPNSDSVPVPVRSPFCRPSAITSRINSKYYAHIMISLSSCSGIVCDSFKLFHNIKVEILSGDCISGVANDAHLCLILDWGQIKFVSVVWEYSLLGGVSSRCYGFNYHQISTQERTRSGLAQSALRITTYVPFSGPYA